MLFTILRLRRPLPCLGGSGGVSLWSWPEGSGSTKRERERERERERTRSTAGENPYGGVGLVLLYGDNHSILRINKIFTSLIYLVARENKKTIPLSSTS